MEQSEFQALPHGVTQRRLRVGSAAGAAPPPPVFAVDLSSARERLAEMARVYVRCLQALLQVLGDACVHAT